MPWLPAIDNDILSNQPLDMIEQGKVSSSVDVVIGSLLNESAIWIPSFLLNFVTEVAISDLEWGSSGSSVREFYKSIGYSSPDTRFEAALTDYLFTCYVRRLADALVYNGNRVSLYTFKHVASYNAGIYDDAVSTFIKLKFFIF